MTMWQAAVSMLVLGPDGPEWVPVTASEDLTAALLTIFPNNRVKWGRGDDEGLWLLDLPESADKALDDDGFFEAVGDGFKIEVELP